MEQQTIIYIVLAAIVGGLIAYALTWAFNRKKKEPEIIQATSFETGKSEDTITDADFEVKNE